MEITGKIIQVLPEVGGVSKAGNEWKKQEYVLETHDQPGEELTVSFDIDSREYQGRWFTSINAWKVDRPMAAAPQAAPMGVTPDNFAPASAPTAPASSAPDFGPANPIDDLPF